MPQEPPLKRDAIIFVPGLGREILDQNIGTIARKLVDALERHCEVPEQTFEIGGGPEEVYGQIYRASVRAINSRKRGGAKTRLFDLYELDYDDTLSSTFKERNPLSKVVVMLTVLVSVLPRFLMSFKRHGKDLKDQLQMLVVAGIMLAVAAYVAMLISAGALSLWDQFKKMSLNELIEYTTPKEEKGAAGSNAIPENQQRQSDKATQNNSASAGPTDETKTGQRDSENRVAIRPVQILILILAAFGLLSNRNLKDLITSIAVEYVCACNYLRLAEQKPAVLGQAAALLEKIAEKTDSYRAVHVVSYSFGSLVALDFLYPHSLPCARLSLVKSLVTIGCPFDLIRTYWPEYFTRRKRFPGPTPEWINIYAPLDVFGSNFRNDANLGEAEQGISFAPDDAEKVVPNKNISYEMGFQVGQLGALGVIAVKGIRIHSLYWTSSNEPELNCFDHIAAELLLKRNNHQA